VVSYLFCWIRFQEGICVNTLTEGNAAKLYCLNWIEQYVAQKGAVSILDLGCGTAGNFIKLLQKYPDVHYTGIEPSPVSCDAARRNLSGLNATIINSYAYNVYGRLVRQQADLIVSFSVFEHVYRRLDYLRTAKTCLKPDGFFLINYDAGHFVQPVNLQEHAKNFIGPLMARLGQERYYQAFVREADFVSMAGQVNLKIIEARSFNTRLKGIYKLVPPDQQADYMQKWLDFEEWLNSLNVPYDDKLASSWFTRNFILTHAT
jgi:SAM-dependent methyltransferase